MNDIDRSEPISRLRALLVPLRSLQVTGINLRKPLNLKRNVLQWRCRVPPISALAVSVELEGKTAIVFKLKS